MAVTAWHGPSIVGGSVQGNGANEWVNPDRAAAQDGLYATADPSDVGQDGESFDKFGFAIPGGDAITGIELSIVGKKVGTGNDTKISAQMFKFAGFGRTLQGVAHDVGPWSLQTDQTFAFGGDGELWGTTWTPVDINGIQTGFFLLVQDATTGGAKLNIDVILMRVYHGVAGGSVASAASGSYRRRRVG